MLCSDTRWSGVERRLPLLQPPGVVYVFLEELPHQVKFQETVGVVIGTQLNISPQNPTNRLNLSSLKSTQERENSTNETCDLYFRQSQKS